MKMHRQALIAATAVLILSTPAMGKVINDTTVVVTPANPSWRALPDTGTAVITSTAPRSGTGSLELRGDRTRFAYGNIFPNSATTNIANLRDVTGLTFDWRIAGDSVSMLNPDYTPALRLSIFDSTTNLRRDLVWEGVYNGTYGNTDRDTWYTSSVNDRFFLTGPGIPQGNENNGRTVADWAAFFGENSFVGGISVGQGSSAGVGYHAFADNVTLSTVNGSTTFNFETAAAGAVPETATWGMMIAGFGMMGGAMRTRRRSTKVTFA